MSILGTRVVRTEDPRLLTAGGTYTDDLRLPELAGALRVTFVRSPVAHAEITSIDAKAALDSPGVVAVLTAADADDLPPSADRPTTEPLLATDRVRYVGEPVAIVLTEDGYQGEDAAELVSVDYQPLAAVVGVEAALADESLLFPAAGSNVLRSGGEPGPGRRVRRLRRGGAAHVPEPAGGPGPAGGPRGRRQLGGRPAHPVGQHAERAAGPGSGGRGARPGRGGGAGRHAGRRRRLRRQDRHGPGHDRGGLGRPPARPAAALGGDPEREPARHGARPGPAAHDPDRRHPGRPDPRLPPGHRPGLRGLPAARAVPAQR